MSEEATPTKASFLRDRPIAISVDSNDFSILLLILVRPGFTLKL